MESDVSESPLHPVQQHWSDAFGGTNTDLFSVFKLMKQNNQMVKIHCVALSSCKKVASDSLESDRKPKINLIRQKV